MSIKQKVKSIIGIKLWNKSVSYCKYFKDFSQIKRSYTNLSSSQMIEEYEVFYTKGKHIFFGYYDIQQLNKEEDKLLVHKVRKGANTSRDKCEIGYYDLASKKYYKISDTNAWCWQQGARLRWHPLDKNKIIFNNMIDSKYITEIWDIEEKKCLRKIDYALYDIDSNFEYGLTLNFSRLQRLRPGYGYDTLDDKTNNISIPENEGIYKVDLHTGESKLIINLKHLVMKNEVDKNCEYYINHISISPNGEYFIFFYIQQPMDGGNWKTILYVSERNGEIIKKLEEADIVSHYTWKNDNEILVTCYGDNKVQYYAIYDIRTGDKNVIAGNYLSLDGHPTYTKDEKVLVSDTYPQKYSLQELYIYDFELNKKQTIARLYSDPRMYGEKRCDLHPRLSNSENLITIDSTLYNGLRSIILIKIKK